MDRASASFTPSVKEVAIPFFQVFATYFVPLNSVPATYISEPNPEILLESFHINEYCNMVWIKIQELDKRIQETEPFKVVKVDIEKGKELIKENIKKLYEISKLLIPILPETSLKIEYFIKQNKKPENPLFLRK